MVLQQLGLEPQRDVQLIAVRDAPGQREALRVGQIDAAWRDAVSRVSA